MIVFNDFNFAYQKRFPIYSDMNLELTPGKIYGLFGKNGAGKSTLLKNITGLNSPTKGTVLVNGKKPGKRQPTFLNEIFMISEEVYIPSISTSNFINTYGGFYPNFSKQDFEAHLSELEVPQTKKLNKLSFGQQKKFIIAFGLACNTKIVVMDEPTNGLDIPSKTQFRKLLAKTITDDKLFLISTHQVRDLDHLIDHIVIVNQGKVIINESIQRISEKIAFNFYVTKPTEGIIAAEEVIGGHAVMEKNTEGEETTVNLEQLFNTAVVDSEKITPLFN